jgi:GNAT superfamily N-acetyltransferase
MNIEYFRFSECLFGRSQAARSVQIRDLLQTLSERGIDDWERNIPAALRDPNTEVFAAKVDSLMVGMVTLNIIQNLRGPYGEINDLVVRLLEFRGLGIARRLMTLAHSHAWVRGCDRIKLTSGEHRKEARALYTSMGYHVKETGVFCISRPKEM